MGLAVSLVFDEATTARVRSLWEALREAGISASMLDVGYAPHLTLVVIPDDMQAERLRHKLTRRQWGSRLEIVIGPVDNFDGTEVVYLAGAADGLGAMHRAACELVTPHEIDPYYRPENWMPHVTLQTSGAAEAAISLAKTAWPTSILAQAIAMELIQFHPVAVLWRAEL